MVIKNVEDRLLSAHHRRELRQNQLTHGRQVALPLEHAAEFGQVRLEPVLLGVLLSGFAQVADHLIDVVFEGGQFALRFDGDRRRQIAGGDRGGHLGNGPHLRR